MTKTLTTKRFEALDILRGMTIAFMCVVNNPGSWSHVFAPLRHSHWNGCTPTDLVYPFFIFCSGCAMAFSFAKFDGFSAAACKKVLVRGLAIFLIGFLLNIFPFFPVFPHNPDGTAAENWAWWIQHIRTFGVLQRIALSYILAGVIVLWLKKPLKVGIAAAVLMLLHTAILLIFSPKGEAFTLEGSFAGKFDALLVGENHLYTGYGIPFDPEGVLGMLTGAASALLGYLVGGIARSRKGDEMVSRMFFYGCIMLILGQMASIWVPINKPLWTATYSLNAAGWSTIALGFISYLTEVHNHGHRLVLFRAMGTNALFAFVFSYLLAVSLWYGGVNFSAIFGRNEFTSLAWALLFASVVAAAQWILYKKKIIIKL